MISLYKKGIAKYVINKEVFLDEDANSFYLLGAYMSDGCLNTSKKHLSFSISSCDEDWLEIIRDLLSPTRPVRTKTDNLKVLSMSNIDIMNWLIEYGCTNKKSLTVELQKPIPEKYHPDFVRGLIDGDGCLTESKYKKILKNDVEKWYPKNTLYLCGASEKIIDQVIKMIPEGINYSKSCYTPEKVNSYRKDNKIIATCNIYRLSFADSNARKMAKWLYYDGHSLSMPRKAKIAKEFIKQIK